MNPSYASVTPPGPGPELFYQHRVNPDVPIEESPARLTDEEYEPVMLFTNHSCEPNVGFAGNTVLAAMRDVEPGEELTTDYVLFDTPATKMRRSCGTPSGRGEITGDDCRNPELRRRYAGWFSRYLADRQAALG